MASPGLGEVRARPGCVVRLVGLRGGWGSGCRGLLRRASGGGRLCRLRRDDDRARIGDGRFRLLHLPPPRVVSIGRSLVVGDGVQHVERRRDGEDLRLGVPDLLLARDPRPTTTSPATTSRRPRRAVSRRLRGRQLVEATRTVARKSPAVMTTSHGCTPSTTSRADTARANSSSPIDARPCHTSRSGCSRRPATTSRTS